MNLANRIKYVLLAPVLLSIDCLYAGTPAPAAIAPESLVGWDLVLQIEKVQTKIPTGYPYKGALVKRYKADGTFRAQGTGTMAGATATEKQVFDGTYAYARTGTHTATELSIDTTVDNTPLVIEYTFDTPTSGRWEEDFGHGTILFSGRFSLVSSTLEPEKHWAPAVKGGSNVALIIKDAQSNIPPNAYPRAGLVLQTYDLDGTLVFKGFGPGTVNSTGTYKYTKIAANTAVEEVNQVSANFAYPYTMVYTYTSPTSGTWFQNFGDGLILFSGTFDTFPN